MNKLLKKAFTLIELLIVIAIMGILTALITSNLQSARSRARDARRKSDLNSVQQALRLYYSDHQSFPLTAEVTWGSPLTDVNGTVYMNILPYDPTSSTTTPVSYSYTSATGASYIIVANLENLSDPDIADSQLRCSGPNGVSDYIVCEE